MNEERSHALVALAARRWRIARALTASMLVTYFGFVLLVAYDKPLLGKILMPGLSLGILLGALAFEDHDLVIGATRIAAEERAVVVGLGDRHAHEVAVERGHPRQIPHIQADMAQAYDS